LLTLYAQKPYALLKHSSKCACVPPIRCCTQSTAPQQSNSFEGEF